MPPFGTEGEEKRVKPLPFASFGHARAPSKKPPSKLYGVEPEESGKPVRPSSTPTPRSRVFQDEPEEHVMAPRKKQRVANPALFGTEPEENQSDDSGSPSSSSDEHVPMKQTVFSLGWHSMTALQNASFWKENSNDKNSVQPKRTYNNAKRSSEAVYAREKGHGVHKRNGLAPSRLVALFDLEKCQCAMNAYSLTSAVTSH